VAYSNFNEGSAAVFGARALLPTVCEEFLIHSSSTTQAYRKVYCISLDFTLPRSL